MSTLRALQQQLAEALRAPSSPALAALRGDARADANSRLGVYRHGYRVRLREALATEFPGLALLAGQRMTALLDAYVAAQPSRHFNLRWHGEGLAAWLAASTPWCQRPELAEMAALDWAISTAFDAADHASLTRAALAGVAAEQWADLRLHPLPHARLVPATCNIDAFRRAADRGRPRPALRRLRRPRTLLVWRPALEVRYRALAPDERLALQGALAGDSLAQLCEQLARRHAPSAWPRMAALLGQWLDEGLLGALGPP